MMPVHTMDPIGDIAKPYSRRVETAAFLSLLAVVAALTFASVDRELRFYDAGAYIVTGKAIAAGVGYRNLNLPGAEPQVRYPPVVPYLLAAVWRAYPRFPDNLVVMRAGMVVLGICFLIVTRAYLIRTHTLTSWEATGVVSLIAFHPVFVQFATETSSEIPYACGASVALYGYARLLERHRVAWWCLTALGIVIAVLTRSIGIGLVLGIVVDALYRERRREAVAIGLLGAACAMPWSIWAAHAKIAYDSFPQQVAANYSDYGTWIVGTQRVERLSVVIRTNVSQFLFNWSSYIVPWIPAVGAVVFVLFVAHPLVTRMFKERYPHDVYCVIATALIVAWPWPLNSRFVFVLSPFLLAYSIQGLVEIVPRVVRWRSPTLVTSLVLLTIFAGAVTSDVAQLFALRRSESSAAQIYAEFHDLAEWIKANTPRDAVFFTGSDPAYYLFADRKTVRLAYPDPFVVYYEPVQRAHFVEPDKVLGWFRSLNGCYVIKDPLLGRAESKFFAELIDSLQSTAAMIQLHVTPDRQFALLRLRACDE